MVALKKKTKKHLPTLLLVTLMISSFSLLKDDPDINRIISQLETFNKRYPQQKVYLHTDKSVYYINENIWIKAYVVNVIDHTPDTISTNLYIDLVSPHNRVFNRLLLKLDQGIGYGDIALDIVDSLPDGNYQLRAYTNWMLNFDKKFIFTKKIQIRNKLYQQYLERSKFIENKNVNKKLRKDLEKVTVEFFPEGGYLLSGLPNRVAFKATDGSGIGRAFKGSVTDSKGRLVTEVGTIHKGMGVFTMNPRENEKYYLVTHDFGGKMKTQLPTAINRGIGMSVDNLTDEGNIIINLFTNIKAAYDEVANKAILIGQTRNRVYYTTSVFLPKNGSQVKIPKSTFPAGVTQFTLFNNLLEPVCERLIFIKHPDASNQNYNYEKIVSDKEGFAKYRIHFENAPFQDETVNLSLAILSNDSASILEGTDNILSHLLLTSDITGNIEAPAYYFPDDVSMDKALDMVMMINGWRRFVWKDIMANKYSEIDHPVENGITISGKLTRFHFDIPINGGKVTLFILNEYNDFFTYETKEKGKFIFEGLEYYDTLDVKIEARTPIDRKNLLIEIDETESPDLIRYDREALLAKQDKKNMRVPNYPKVEQTNDYNVSSIHGTPDFVLDLDKINTDGYSNLFQVIDGRVPGVEVSGNSVTIRGTRSFNAGSDPLVVFDGIPTDIGMLGITNPADVRIIEILKGPSTAIYGFRGANGVIAVYTRRGEFMVRGEITFQMLGYYRARKFYRPTLIVIDGNENKEIKSTTLLWEPQLEMNNSGDVSFYIKEEDVEPLMKVILEGISTKGNIICDQSVISE